MSRLVFAVFIAVSSIAVAQPASPTTSPAPRVDSSAAEMLASLNRAADAIGSVDQVIQRYERFIAANAGTQAAEDAQRQLAVWQDRKARGLKKINGQWLSPEEIQATQRDLPAKIASARQLVTAGQARDAESLLNEVLELDPKNIGALYLQGVLLYQQDKVPLARKSFEAVNAQIEAHAPTVNNLAVINFRQNQHGAALNLFDQAMDAAPLDRTIIDNIAEALNALNESQKRGTIYTKVVRKFVEQEAALAGKLRAEGLYRWGATWVEKAQYDQLVEAEKEVQKKIQQYKADFESLGARVQGLNQQIDDAERELKRIEADSYYLTTDGRFIRRALPSYYYDERRRRDGLVSERVQTIAQQKALREQADRVTQDLPVPKFTGVQKLIGDEGTPVEATTQPS